jgi:hypothetical protein
MSSSSSLSRTRSSFSTTRASYEHEPLDRTRDSFRLIQILPERSADNLLQLSLWHDNVSSASYRCLSYRWGDEARRHTLLINGLLFNVGDNLYSFLEEAYSSKNTSSTGIGSSFWIDFICINQYCVQERGHQVQHMGSIYTKAQEVLIWLGLEKTPAPSLCDWVNAKEWSECPGNLRQQWDIIRFNPYWYRAWIVQEILLAKCIKVVLPGLTLDYYRLGRAITRSADLSQLEEDSAAQLWSFWFERWGNPHSRHTSDPVTLNYIKHERDRDGFWNLIQMHKRAKCKDERDRIYSLLGLISDHNFKVDYNETTADLFWRVGEHFDAWEAPELVDILRVALLGNESSNNSVGRSYSHGISPWLLIDSLKTRPDFHVRIPIRRASPTTSLFGRFTRQTRCKFKDCRRAPPLRCTHNDILLCTNARSSGPTEHGCIHGLVYPVDKPPSEPFKIRMEAHHGKDLACATLPPTALQVLDDGTNTWFGVSTWSSLQKALDKKDLDRTDRVKLQVPAKYAIWIWFGIHPDQLKSALVEHHPELPSALHALPSGTRVTRNSIEVPLSSLGMDGEVYTTRNGIFDV